MKKLSIIFLLGFILTSPAQNPKMEEWLEVAEEDISLLPEYGNVEKTAEEKEIDAAFIAKVLEEWKNAGTASEELARAGFQYLYERGDLVMAMRKFNEAYLLNPRNPDAYLGFGTIYFTLGAYEEARELYDKGLKIDPENAPILTNYGTTWLGEYYKNFDTDRELAEENLDKALEYFLQSEEIDDSNSDTIFKLSIVYLYRENCRLSRKYLEKAKKLKHPNIPLRYEQQLKASC